MRALIPHLLLGTALVLTTVACDEKKAATPAPGEAKAGETPKKDTPKKAEAPKAEEPKKEAPAKAEPKPAEPTKEEAPKAAAAAADNYLKVDIMHHDTSKGMVNASFSGLELVKANVDLSKPETAMAEIHIDLGSFKSGIPKRDNHVKSSDFLDIAKFPKAKLVIKDVKPGEGADHYAATATLSLKGIEKSMPVSFKVVERKDDGSITVEGQVDEFSRADFQVGGTPEQTNAAATMKVSMRMTLANKG